MNHTPEYDTIIILHGCPPSRQLVTTKKDRWMNWLAEKLTENGYDAVAPDMPASWSPKYPDWKTEFEKYPVTDKTMLVGHSCGAAFLVRWLLETHRKVKKLILVAPAKVPEGDVDPRKDLYNFRLPADASGIADEIVVFASNDLPHHKQSLELYMNSLKPRKIELEDMVHFLFFQMKTREFPEILTEALMKPSGTSDAYEAGRLRK